MKSTLILCDDPQDSFYTLTLYRDSKPEALQ